MGLSLRAFHDHPVDRFLCELLVSCNSCTDDGDPGSKAPWAILPPLVRDGQGTGKKNSGGTCQRVDGEKTEGIPNEVHHKKIRTTLTHGGRGHIAQNCRLESLRQSGRELWEGSGG